MVRHQAIGCYAQISLLRGFNQEVDKPDISIGVSENEFDSPAAVQDMITGIGIFYSQGSGHA